MSIPFQTVATRLPTQDLARARRWYAETLGLQPVEERPGGLRYLVGGCEFVLYQSTGKSDGSFTQIAFTVADIDAAVAQLKARGVGLEEYDEGPFRTANGIAAIQGNYPARAAAKGLAGSMTAKAI